MLTSLQKVVHSTRSPTPSLQRVPEDLAQITAMTHNVSRKLEDLGNYLLQIIRDQNSTKEIIERFNSTFESTHTNLQNCISDMQKVKLVMDGELRSARGSGVQFNASATDVGIFSLAAGIIGPFVVGLLGFIAALGISDAAGNATVARYSTAIGAALQLQSAYKNFEEMNKRFGGHDTWELMDNKLKVLNDDLQNLQSTRALNTLVNTVADYFFS